MAGCRSIDDVAKIAAAHAIARARLRVRLGRFDVDFFSVHGNEMTAFVDYDDDAKTRWDTVKWSGCLSC
jgi:hypothetical protein